MRQSALVKKISKCFKLATNGRKQTKNVLATKNATKFQKILDFVCFPHFLPKFGKKRDFGLKWAKIALEISTGSKIFGFEKNCRNASAKCFFIILWPQIVEFGVYFWCSSKKSKISILAVISLYKKISKNPFFWFHV